MFTPDRDGAATLHLAVQNPDPYAWASSPSVVVYDACGGQELACKSRLVYGVPEATLDLIWLATRDTPYFVRVEESSQGSGYDFSLCAIVQPAVPNDRWEDAFPLVMNVPAVGSTAGATGTDLTSCGADDTGDVWYTFTAETSGAVFLNLCESGTATHGTLAVFDACGGSEWRCMGPDENYVELPVALGTVYLVRIAGCLDTPIEFTLHVMEAGPPVNDACSQALPLTLDTPIAGNTFGATGTDITSCAFWDGKDVWYAFRPRHSGAAEFALTDMDPCVFGALAVFDGCGGAELACSYDSLRMSVQQDWQYLIRVSGHDNRGYRYALRASQPAAPPNDACGHAAPLPADTLIMGTTIGAGGDLDVPLEWDRIDVWYVFTPEEDGAASFSLCERDFGLDTTLAVYDQCQGNRLAYNDDAFGLLSMVRLAVERGRTYLVRVAARGGAWGDFALRATLQPQGTCTPDDAEYALLNGTWQWLRSDEVSGESVHWTFDNSGCVNTYRVERQSWSMMGDAYTAEYGTYTLDASAGWIILAVAEVCSEFYCDTYRQPEIRVQPYVVDGACLFLGTEILAPPGAACEPCEGATEAELAEGEGGGTGELYTHSADQNRDGCISLSELLRIIQFFNSEGYHCAPGAPDGYAPGSGGVSCVPHASDYAPQDWDINLGELLRGIQFFNLRGYHACSGQGAEDGYCGGPAG